MSKHADPPCKCSNLNCADLSCGRLDFNPPDDPDKTTDALGRPKTFGQDLRERHPDLYDEVGAFGPDDHADGPQQGPLTAEQARLEVKAAVEEWFSDVDLTDLFAVKGWGGLPGPVDVPASFARLVGEVMQNKHEKGFNVTDVPLELCMLQAEASELFEAWRKGTPVADEMADIGIFLLGLAGILGVDLGRAIESKIAVNAGRSYVHGPVGLPVRGPDPGPPPDHRPCGHPEDLCPSPGCCADCGADL